MSLLEIENVSVSFGGVVALDSVGFAIERGNICGLIGPNGAGKTTLFNCVSRVYQPSQGRISYDGVDLLKLRACDVPSLGISRTFQNLGLLLDQSVMTNVLLGAHHRMRTPYFASLLHLPPSRREERRIREACMQILRDLNIDHLAHTTTGGLPFGTLKRIELARALASDPTLILVDEPANGLTHSEVDELGDLLLQLREDHNLTVLLVEHHMRLVMRVSDKIVALALGKKILDDTPEKAQEDEALIAAYFGSPT